MKPEAYSPFFLDGENWDSAIQYADAYVFRNGRKLRKIKSSLRPGTKEYSEMIEEIKYDDIKKRTFNSYLAIYTYLASKDPFVKDFLVSTQGGTFYIDPDFTGSENFLQALNEVRRSLLDSSSLEKLMRDRIVNASYKFLLYRNSNLQDYSSDDTLSIEWKKQFPDTPQPENQDVAIPLLIEKTRGKGWAESTIRSYYNGTMNIIIANLINGEMNKKEAEELIFIWDPVVARNRIEAILGNGLELWADANGAKTHVDNLRPSEREKLSKQVYALFKSGDLDLEFGDVIYTEYEKQLKSFKKSLTYKPLYKPPGTLTKRGRINISGSPLDPRVNYPLTIDGVVFSGINEFVAVNPFLDLYREYSKSSGTKNPTNKEVYELSRFMTVDKVYSFVRSNAVARANIAKFSQNSKALKALLEFKGALPVELQKIKDTQLALDFRVFEDDKFKGLDKGPLPGAGNVKQWVEDMKVFVEQSIDEIRRVTKFMIKDMNEVTGESDGKVTPGKMRVICTNLLLNSPEAPAINMNLYVPPLVIDTLFKNTFEGNFDPSSVPVIQDYVYRRLYWTNLFANKEGVSLLQYKPSVDCSCRNGYLERMEQCTSCALVHILRVMQRIYPLEVLTPMRIYQAVSLISKTELRLIQKEAESIKTWTRELPMETKKQLGSSFRQVMNPAVFKLFDIAVHTLANSKDTSVVDRVKRFSAAYGQVAAGVPDLGLKKSSKRKVKKWVQGPATRIFEVEESDSDSDSE